MCRCLQKVKKNTCFSWSNLHALTYRFSYRSSQRDFITFYPGLSMANILLLGSGAREHAIAWKLAESPCVAHVFVAPGNGGTGCGLNKVSNVELALHDHNAISEWCSQHDIKLVVVGPEDPLANGIVDDLSDKGYLCFGPTANAAQIEASKAFAKSVMDSNSIPTARWEKFTDADAACHFITNAPYAALVVKASGLAAGKGVVVASTREEACHAAREMLQMKVFGQAGDTLVVEELLEGEEVSVLCFTDGKTIACLPSAQDHKRLKENDEGPNTGGMGAYAPCPWLAAEDYSSMTAILQKTVDALAARGTPFRGVLYGGFMLTAAGPKVLEFNCRLGDPETQVLLPLMRGDLFKTMLACANGTLAANLPEFEQEAIAVGVVMASAGYPGPYEKGFAISGLADAEALGCHVFHAGTTRNESRQLATAGGRVLTVTAVRSSLIGAVTSAQAACKTVKYDGAIYRKDIAFKALSKLSPNLGGGLTYASAGVDIVAGDELVDSIKPLAAATARPGCSAELGLFGSVFDLKATAFRDPLLVSGTDGVGTKLKVAQACNIHSTIGIDLVAMCVNDVLAHGAEPLFFLDYFASGKLDVSVARSVVRGIADGCLQAGCALAGGETAEMPGMYANGEYDVAGFAVGAVERALYLPRIEDIVAGDVVIGIPSSGLHSNGFSLVRRVVEYCGLPLNGHCPFDHRARSLGEALLTPTRIYVKALLPTLRSGYVKALAHITGGGLPENLPRVLPRGVDAHIDAASWPVPPVFGWLQREGHVDPSEMSVTFNCGIGIALVVSSAFVQQVVALLKDAGEDQCYVIGRLVKNAGGDARVVISNMAEALLECYTPKIQSGNAELARHPKRVGVLISGSGTNLQALIDHIANTSAGRRAAEIVLVISNVPDVEGLRRAQRAGIATQVINHRGYKTREDYDAAVTAALEDAGAEIVCLAGFMRIVSGAFVRRWRGSLLNIHPALLPSFRGMNAHEQALQAGVKVTGCTVHFVEEEVDAGPILVQEAVPVLPGDTVATLSERVKAAEHKAYPRALCMLAEGQVYLSADGKLIHNQ